MPKVSVIVPVYQAEKYLPACIKSLKEQSLSDFEAWLVDDGSTDNSGALCDEAAKSDERFRVIHQKNAGVSAARNAALNAGTGEYFCFVDADDTVDSDYLELLVKNAQRENAVLSACLLYREKRNTALEADTVFNRNQALFSLLDDRRGIRGFAGGKLYRTDRMRKNSIRFCEKTTLLEDLLFHFDYLSQCAEGDKIVFTTEEPYRYISHDESALTQRDTANEYKESWNHTIRSADMLIERAERFTKTLDKKTAVQLMRTVHHFKAVQCVTQLRILARHNRMDTVEYKNCRRFLLRHLVSLLFDKKIALRKKVGAVAVLIIPKI